MGSAPDFHGPASARRSSPTLSPANPSSNRRDWTYDAAGRLVTTAETTASNTTSTLTTSYDGDGLVLREAQVGGPNPSTYYLVRSSVLGGQVVTRLTAAGAKNYTYVPAEGVREVWQEVSTFNAQQIVNSTNMDPLGVLAPGGIAYDPLGHQIVVQNPVAGQPPSGAQYGPSYYGAGSGFTDAYNLSSGCLSVYGNPAACSNAMRERMGQEFWDSLPGVYNDMERGEQRYVNSLYEIYQHIHDTTEHQKYVNAFRLMDGYRNANGLFDLDLGNAQTRSRERPMAPRHPSLYNFYSSCWLNFILPYSQGVGQSYREFNGVVDHDGDHLRAGLGIPGIVGVLPVINGAYVEKTGDQGDGLHYMDVRLPTGDVAVFKDLASLSYKDGERLVGGSILGYTRPGTANNVDNVGLHLTIVTKEFYDRKVNNYRSVTRQIMAERKALNAITTPTQIKFLRSGVFVRLDSDRSPFRCR